MDQLNYYSTLDLIAYLFNYYPLQFITLSDFDINLYFALFDVLRKNRLIIKQGERKFISEIRNPTNSRNLGKAIEEGYLFAVIYLINRGVDIDSQNFDFYGGTALILAARNGHLNIVELLIEKGANINVDNEFGETALMLAAINGHKEIVRMLIEYDADIHTPNNDTTLLMWTALNGQKEIIELLIEKGADVNARNSFGDTALKYAASERHIKVIKILIDKGANINDLTPEQRKKYGV